MAEHLQAQAAAGREAPAGGSALLPGSSGAAAQGRAPLLSDINPTVIKRRRRGRMRCQIQGQVSSFRDTSSL